MGIFVVNLLAVFGFGCFVVFFGFLNFRFCYFFPQKAMFVIMPLNVRFRYFLPPKSNTKKRSVNLFRVRVIEFSKTNALHF